MQTRFDLAEGKKSPRRTRSSDDSRAERNRILSYAVLWFRSASENTKEKCRKRTFVRHERKETRAPFTEPADRIIKNEDKVKRRGSSRVLRVVIEAN